MPTANSLYRFAPPDPRMLEPSALETALASQVSQPGLKGGYAGGLYQLESASRQRGAQEYMETLSGLNAMQRLLAERELAIEHENNLQKNAIDVGDKLKVDTINLAPLQSMLRSPELTMGTDNLRRNMLNATALKDTGEGLNQASLAGVNLNPGQSTQLQPGDLANLKATTGEARDITKERLSQAPKVTAMFPNVGGEGGDMQISATAHNATDAINLANDALRMHGGSTTPTTTNLQNTALQTAVQTAAQHGAKIVSKQPQGNNIIITFDRPVLGSNGRSYRQVVVDQSGKMRATQ